MHCVGAILICLFWDYGRTETIKVWHNHGKCDTRLIAYHIIYRVHLLCCLGFVCAIWYTIVYVYIYITYFIIWFFFIFWVNCSYIIWLQIRKNWELWIHGRGGIHIHIGPPLYVPSGLTGIEPVQPPYNMWCSTSLPGARLCEAPCPRQVRTAVCTSTFNSMGYPVHTDIGWSCRFALIIIYNGDYWGAISKTYTFVFRKYCWLEEINF